MAVVASLKKPADYSAVYRTKASKANRLLVLYKKKSDLVGVRVGVSISKKVGNSVVRHRLKRQLREIVRLAANRLPDGFDLVFVVRVSAKGCGYRELESAFWNLVKRHGLVSRRDAAVS